VIQTISVVTGKNFIIDPRVHGTITLVSQKPMTPNELYQVFLSMLQLLQYVAIPAGNAIKIVPAMDGNSLSRQVATSNNPGIGDEIVVRVVPVNHVSATQLVPVLRPLMSQSGSVSAYLPSNTLILAGTASNIKRLVTVVRQMDVVNASEISVVHLHYANAGKIVSIIKTLQSGGAAQGIVSNATLAADSEDNSVLINANLANTIAMKNLIRQLDQQGAGGDDTRVVVLNYLSAKKLAPILMKVAQGMNVSESVASGKTATATTMGASDSNASNVSVEPEISTNAVIIHAPKAMMSGLMRVIRRLDVKPKEVLVEAIIVKMDEGLLNKLGIVWGTSDGSAVAAAVQAGATASSAALAATNTFAVNANHHFGFLPDGNLIAILHALKQNSASDVLATPSVVVLNNEKASILDGQQIGVANRSYQGADSTTTGNPAQNSVTPFNTIERQDVALSLDVTPHISPNNMIRMALLQKDDSVASDNTEQNQENENPTLNTSRIKTSVLVKSGDILVLGGLMNNTQEKVVQKLPILGDIPVIGHLFRYTTHQIQKTSLMVFIRPVIMSKRNAKEQTMNRYAYSRHQQIDLATESVRKQGAMPLLPRLQEPTVRLPQPVSTPLPVPTTTIIEK
jgi:general secretion pathway protein D